MRNGDRVVTTIAFKNGRVVFLAGRACTSCCEPVADGCDCPETVPWGDQTKELTFTVLDGDFEFTCTLCADDGTLTREPAGDCRYSAEYDLFPCLAVECAVKVIFDIGPFPACDCNGDGGGCEYAVVAWEVVGGACQVTDVSDGAAC